MKTPKNYLKFIPILFLFLFSCEQDLKIDQTITSDVQLELRDGQDKNTVPSTNPPIKIKFDAKPSKEDFKKKVEEELDKAIKQAKKDKDVILKVALESRKKNFSENVDAIYTQFCFFDGINLTWFYVHFWKNQLHVESINIQLYKAPPTDLVETHEDGHSLIADSITIKLTEKIAKAALDMGKKGKKYWQFVQSELARLDNCAQECYDAIVGHENLQGTPERQTMVAKKVAKAIIEAYCENAGFDCAALCQQLIIECQEDPEDEEDPEDPEGDN